VFPRLDPANPVAILINWKFSADILASDNILYGIEAETGIAIIKK
jgi:hypothetical protein